MRKRFLDRLDVSYETACMTIQSTIRDSAYFGSVKQVDAKSDSKERVDRISDSNEQVEAVSKEKLYRDYIL